VLLNIALHGPEEAAGVRYCKLGRDAAQTVAGSPVLVRYADDLLAICHSREQAEQVKAQLAAWLAPRGLAFNKDKTRIVYLTQGADFLGCNIRRYPSGKLLIKPSQQAIRRIRERLATEMRALRWANAIAVIRTSTRSCGAGRPTTGAWCPRRCSPPWMTICGGSRTTGYLRMLTARATTRTTVTSDTADCSSMVIFAQRDSGITSVGLKAVALVNDRYR
jgi:hypothetical protein